MIRIILAIGDSMMEGSSRKDHGRIFKEDVVREFSLPFFHHIVYNDGEARMRTCNKIIAVHRPKFWTHAGMVFWLWFNVIFHGLILLGGVPPGFYPFVLMISPFTLSGHGASGRSTGLFDLVPDSLITL